MTLAHDVTGDGPAVLLLHSTVCDRRMWDPLVPALAEAGHRVIRCDLGGFGDSPVPTGRYNDADDVAALLGDESVAVVGSSGGGRVALELAARRPGRVTALVLLATALRGHEPSAALRAFGEREDELLAAGDVAAATELNVDRWLGPLAGEPTRAAVRVMQRHAFEVQLAAADPEPVTYDYALSAITAPALLVSGAHDLPDFHDIAVRLTAELPDATHRHLDWAGHLPSLESPGRLTPALVSFLRRR